MSVRKHTVCLPPAQVISQVLVRRIAYGPPIKARRVLKGGVREESGPLPDKRGRKQRAKRRHDLATNKRCGDRHGRRQPENEARLRYLDRLWNRVVDFFRMKLRKRRKDAGVCFVIFKSSGTLLTCTHRSVRRRQQYQCILTSQPRRTCSSVPAPGRHLASEIRGQR